MRPLILALLLGGCSYHLGHVTAVPAGKTQAEGLADVAVCKERASAAVTPAKEATYFVAGLTLVGTPAAIADEKQTKRPVWVACMREKGYTVGDAVD